MDVTWNEVVNVRWKKHVLEIHDMEPTTTRNIATTKKVLTDLSTMAIKDIEIGYGLEPEVVSVSFHLFRFMVLQDNYLVLSSSSSCMVGFVYFLLSFWMFDPFLSQE
jgi:hypothetical protein